MTNAQIDRAIACLSAAPSIGRYSVFHDNGAPCCSIGHLASCAGATLESYRTSDGHTYIEAMPELKTYGLTQDTTDLIFWCNDAVPRPEARREAVIALLNSWRTP